MTYTANLSSLILPRWNFVVDGLRYYYVYLWHNGGARAVFESTYWCLHRLRTQACITWVTTHTQWTGPEGCRESCDETHLQQLDSLLRASKISLQYAFKKESHKEEGIKLGQRSRHIMKWPNIDLWFPGIRLCLQVERERERERRACSLLIKVSLLIFLCLPLI